MEVPFPTNSYCATSILEHCSDFSLWICNIGYEYISKITSVCVCSGMCVCMLLNHKRFKKMGFSCQGPFGRFLPIWIAWWVIVCQLGWIKALFWRYWRNRTDTYKSKFVTYYYLVLLLFLLLLFLLWIKADNSRKLKSKGNVVETNQLWSNRYRHQNNSSMQLVVVLESVVHNERILLALPMAIASLKGEPLWRQSIDALPFHVAAFRWPLRESFLVHWFDPAQPTHRVLLDVHVSFDLLPLRPIFSHTLVYRNMCSGMSSTRIKPFVMRFHETTIDKGYK